MYMYTNLQIVTLTLNIKKDHSSSRGLDTIVSSASVANTCILSSDVGQWHGDKTMIRESCPCDCWCRIAHSQALQCHIPSFSNSFADDIGDLSLNCRNTGKRCRIESQRTRTHNEVKCVQDKCVSFKGL